MKFGTRLILSLVPAIVLLIAGFGYLDEQRTQRHYREELLREGRAISRVIQIALEDAIRDRNFAVIDELVEHMSGFERVYGLRVLTPDGKISYQSESLEHEPLLAEPVVAHVLATGKTEETQAMVGGHKVMACISPLMTPENTVFGALQLFQLESFVSEEVGSARSGIITLSLVMILVTGAVIILVTRLVISRPLGDFIDKIRTIDPHEAEARVAVVGGDELQRLAREFNALWKRLAESHESLRSAENRLKDAERLAALGEMAAGLAHEIGTPLNVIGMKTDWLLRRPVEDRTAMTNLQVISEQIGRITRIVREMLAFARARQANLEPLDLNELVSSVIRFVEHRIEESGVETRIDLAHDLPAVAADKDQIYGVILNLVLNALDSMGPSGILTVRTAMIVRPHPQGFDAPGEFARIELSDTGSGIAPENMERIFNPFFTTKEVGRGTGLGMSVAYGLVREHGGWIEVQSAVGKGTHINVYLPVEPKAIMTVPAGDSRAS